MKIRLFRGAWRVSLAADLPLPSSKRTVTERGIRVVRSFVVAG
jgi:hypothetical protein